MKIQIKIEHPDHGNQIVTTKPADLIKWERATSSKMTDLVKVRRGDDGQPVTEFSIGYEDLAVMAWAIFYRAGDTQKKFDEWVNSLEVVELEGIEEPEIPKAEPSGEPLPN